VLLRAGVCEEFLALLRCRRGADDVEVGAAQERLIAGEAGGDDAEFELKAGNSGRTYSISAGMTMACEPSVKVWKRPRRKASPRSAEAAMPVCLSIFTELSFELEKEVSVLTSRSVPSV